MANRNRAAINLIHRKQLKDIGKPVNSRFGSPENKRRGGPKVYGKNKHGQPSGLSS